MRVVFVIEYAGLLFIFLYIRCIAKNRILDIEFWILNI